MYLEDKLFAAYSADALIVGPARRARPPTASPPAAPSLSPRVEALIFTPVAPHMIFNRSLVLAADEIVGVRVLDRSGQVAVSVDGQPRGVLDPGDWVIVYAAPQRARVARVTRADFLTQVRTRFGLADSEAALADGGSPPDYRPRAPLPPEWRSPDRPAKPRPTAHCGWSMATPEPSGTRVTPGRGGFRPGGAGDEDGAGGTRTAARSDDCPRRLKERGVEMPWFPDFVSAVELARRQTRAAGQADPVAQYLTALNEGDTHALETVWPGEVVVYDPRAGEVRGHRQLRQFVRQNQAWLAERHARIETVASTRVGGRAVVELLAHLDARRAGAGLAGGGRRRVSRRPVGGVPHLLQPVAGRRTAPRPASDPRARARPPR